MPSLLTVLPCERVLFGDDQTISLITVLAEVRFKIFPNVPPPPPQSVSFYKWAVFCQWEIKSGEAGEDWEQQIAFSNPKGEDVFVNVSQFALSSADVLTHRMVASLDMIPFLPEGRYEIIIRYKHAKDSKWVEAGRYPLRFVHEHLALPISEVQPQ